MAQTAFEGACGLLPVEVEQQVGGGGEQGGVPGEDGLMGDVLRQHCLYPDVDDNRGYAHTYAPHVSIGVVSKALKQRRKFDAAARTLGQRAARFNLVPVVDGYIRCLSANCAAWRSENPVPTPAAHLDCRGLVDLVEMVHELRKASAGRQPGSLGLPGGTWQ